MRRSVYFHGCGVGIAILCAALCVDSFFIDPTGQTRDIVVLLSILGGMAVFYFAAVWGIVRGGWNVSLGGVLVWATVFRVLLLPSQPILETDYYRYLWDGYSLSNGFNPYQFSPAEVLSGAEVEGLTPDEAQALERLRGLVRRVGPAHDVLSEVNNPTVITIYPPFAQAAFAISAKFFPLSVYGWRAAILFFEALLIFALAALLSRFGRDPAWSLIYAWSPLVLKETVNTLHFDVVATSLLFLAILFAIAEYGKRSAAAWACAALTKIYPLLAVPLWARRWNWRAWATFAAVLLGSLFIFSGVGSRGAGGWAAFANRWESNSSVVVVLEKALGAVGVPAWGKGSVLFTLEGVAYRLDAFQLSKALCAAFVLGLAAVLAWKARRNGMDDERRLRWTFAQVGAVLVCSPVCNPWYVTWIVPFLCFFPRASWLYLSVACFVHYAFFIPEPWGYIPYAREVEYLPFVGLLVWEWRRRESGIQN